MFIRAIWQFGACSGEGFISWLKYWGNIATVRGGGRRNISLLGRFGNLALAVGRDSFRG